MMALLTNIVLAVLWLMLRQQPTFTSFVVGYIIGFVLIALFSKVIGGQNYVRRTLGFIRFLGLFFVQFIKANLEVARLVLFVPRDQLHSGFVDYPIDELNYSEALFLSHCITLTPGTITVFLDWDKKILQIHILNFSDPDHLQKEIDESLKQQIWKFSR